MKLSFSHYKDIKIYYTPVMKPVNSMKPVPTIQSLTMRRGCYINAYEIQ